MVASGVGQYSINVKSNLRDFYGELSRSKRTMDELVAKKYQLEIDSKQLNELRDKAQRINGEMRELRQQKTEIKLGIREVEDAEAELKNIDKNLASLNRQKLAVEADIQPIRTANAELYKVDQEIDRLNSKKIKVDVSESMKNVGNSFNKMGDGILKAFNPLTSKINQMIGFGLINNLIGKGLNMVTGSVDGAISRVDTLNNFPKTMSNMNIAVEDSEKAIQDLSDGLTGLPTRVDAAANSVQQFTNKNKDIQKSTDMFLSINNAILAGGADMQKQQSALDQLTNAYSVGTMDLNTWRAMQQAMPAQLSQVSQAFQKTDDELYKALQSGNISMDEFMDKIIELNTTGVDGMQSFEQQAKNSVGGLKTSMANMNSAVTRGVAKIITTVDEIGKSKGLDGISGIFAKIGSFFEDGLGKIAETIEKNQDAIFGFFESVVSFLMSIDYASFFKGLFEGLKEMGSMAKGIFNFVKPLFSLLGNGDVTRGLGKLIPKMLMLGFALKGIGLATKGLGSVFGVLGKFKNFKLPSFGFGKGAKGGSTLPLQNIGVEQFKDLGLKLTMIAGLSANVYLAAKAIQQVTKIENMDGIYEKLAVIALAVSGMGLISIAVDKVSKMAGTSMITGLIAITAISAEIYAMSLSLEKLASIEMDFIEIQKKIGSIALVIGEMTLLNVAVGAIMSTGLGAAALTLGIIAITAMALQLMVLAEAIKQLDEKVPNDFGDIKGKLKTMTEVLDAIVESNFAEFGALFDTIIAGFTTAVFKKVIDNLIEVSDGLAKLNNVGGDLNEENIKKNVVAIKEITELLQFDDGFFDSIGKVFKGKVDIKNLSNAQDFINSLLEIAQSLDGIATIEIDKNKINESIATLLEVVNKLTLDNGIIEGLVKIDSIAIDTATTKKAILLVKELTEINSTLIGLETMNFTKDAVLITIGALQDVLDALTGDQSFFYSLNELAKMKMEAGTTENAVQVVSSLLKIKESLAGLEIMQFNKDAVLISITAIQEVIGELTMSNGLMLGLKNLIDAKLDDATYGAVIKTVDILVQLNTEIGKLGVMEFNKEAVLITVGAIKDVIDELSNGGFWSSLTNMAKKKLDDSTYDAALLAVKTLVEMNTELAKLDEMKFKTENVTDSIDEIVKVIKKIAVKDLVPNDFFDHTENLKKFKSMIDGFNELIDPIKKLGAEQFDMEAVMGNIDNVEKIVKRIAEFSNEETTNNIANLAKSITDLITTLNGLSAEFEATGKGYGESLLNGFNEVKVPEAILEKIKKLIADLKGKTQKFKEIGSDWGNALKSSFNSAIQGLGNGIDSQINSMSNKTNAFSTLGNTYGKSLNDGFDNALVMLDNSVNDRISNLQRSISNVQTLSNNSSSANSRRPNPVVLASGGKVSSSTGFARIVDSYEQPILGNGEGIIPKKIMDKIGMPFFEQLRRGQVSPTFANLGKSISNTTSSVVNNIYHNTTNMNQQMTMYTTAAPDAINIMNRRLR